VALRDALASASPDKDAAECILSTTAPAKEHFWERFFAPFVFKMPSVFNVPSVLEAPL
jgi:hypothetical protein